MTVTAAAVDPVTDKGMVRNTATQQVEEPHVVVETRTFEWFDFDWYVCKETQFTRLSGHFVIFLRLFLENWWPHETRGFDIDHDVASKTKGNKDA